MDTGADLDTDNEPLAQTGTPDRTPIILALGSALIAGGIVLGRKKATKRRATDRRG
ncbi:LPXTG cell wall anchor domain-containing protein [Streptomyces erythrochromogenes]|uniref:LPXTG cell wall anchor domain-containing protein n=1 Tax=Streptomyces erythrochromogenes TaxID=285574 RepID=UPI003417D592